ncbi:MAG: hypothetical protein JST39_04720, partial [Bacteroidetes bacterium]|nr:hypothetical protein [Bacteroidota bacterium]
MKKIFLAAGFLLCVSFANSQQRQPNPQLAELRNEKDSTVLAQKLAKLESSGKESDATLLVSYYNSIRNTGKAQEIVDKAVERFPDGEYARIKAINAIYGE